MPFKGQQSFLIISWQCAAFHFYLSETVVTFVYFWNVKGIVHFEINFWYVLAYLKGI